MWQTHSGFPGADASQEMQAFSGFWTYEQNPGGSSLQSGPLKSCSGLHGRAFQPGGKLHFLRPLVSVIPHHMQFKENSSAAEGDDSHHTMDVSPTNGGRADGEPVQLSARRGRRTVIGAQQSSPFLTMSVTSKDQLRDPGSRSPIGVVLMGDIDKAGPNQHQESKPQTLPVASMSGEALATADEVLGVQEEGSETAAGRPLANEPSTDIPNESVKKEEDAHIKIPQVQPSQGAGSAGSSRAAPVPSGAAKEKKSFRIPNPLHAITGFVEEVRDMVHAAAGKKRGPTKESVAAWEEKALAKSLLRKKHASLVLFYSKKCQLCKSLTPMVNEMARKESWWLDVCYVNVDDQNWMPEVVHYDVTYVPCFMYLTPSGMAMAKTGAPHSKTHVLDGLQKVMSGAHPECKLARRRLAEKVRKRQQAVYERAKAAWEAQGRKRKEQENSEKGSEATLGNVPKLGGP